MPKLTIDNVEVDVPEGTNVLEAAKHVGVVIPHFCYHPALGSVGACRLCAMKFLDGPVKGVQMSCMIKAQDGMVVSTTDGEAAQLRKLVIEWLMTNHPHDCPVCDEGGECLLQDYTIAGGHGIRRFKGKKRTFLNQDLGPYIRHEMNRCIECYRCARFYQEYAGGSDFGVLGSAGRVYFGRFSDGAFDSPFSGNLTDICPTGVFTDNTARYRARYWDYDMAPSVCPGCGLGCNVTPVARYRELLKIVPKENHQVNRWFICDRGRFDKSVNSPDRPRTPRVAGEPTPTGEALQALAGEIRSGAAAGRRLLLAGSPRLSLEGMLLLADLARQTGGTLSLFSTAEEQERTVAAVEGILLGKGISLAALEELDFVAVHGADLMEEAPMAALAIRQAWRKGAKVILSDSSSAGLPFPTETFAHIAEACAGGCRRQAIVFGTRRNSASAIRSLARMGDALFPVLPSPNSFAAAFLAMTREAVPLEEAVKGDPLLVCFEADLPHEAPAPLAAADWKQTPCTDAARILLPAAAFTECDGTFVNGEGRAQRFRKVYEPGLPLR
ncbi:MAG TPA: 2Fe-2S iron-sulfur cluster-binding protein, partial [Verrucomicrobiae bacterium]|nr:2Fe-2S iron-sulfur cluster-binding protein [Verrucomicrobiae bacterium]